MRKSVLTLIGGLALTFPQSPLFAQSEEEDGECRFTINQDSSASLTSGCETQILALGSDEERADFLFGIAYALNENDGALGALEMLNRALKLAPDTVGYLHERGYTRADLGFYTEALEDLNRVLEIDPEHKLSLKERGWVRQAIGDFVGANADYVRLLAVGGDEAGFILSRAQNYVWLGQLDEAEADFDAMVAAGQYSAEVERQRGLIARIRAYQPDGDPAKLCELPEDAFPLDLANLLFDACTRAFIDESDPGLKADYLSVRAASRKVIEDDLSAGLEEMQIAVGIDPLVHRRHVNYGYILLMAAHSWAARNAFDVALDMEQPNKPLHAIALAGRAIANYNLGEKDTAHEDAQASIEIEWNAPAFTVMGDLAFDSLDFDVAKEAWLLAWSIDGETEELRAKLASINVFDPDAENGE